MTKAMTVLLIASLVCTALTVLLDAKVEQVSRRFANISFVLWTVKKAHSMVYYHFLLLCYGAIASSLGDCGLISHSDTICSGHYLPLRLPPNSKPPSSHSHPILCHSSDEGLAAYQSHPASLCLVGYRLQPVHLLHPSQSVYGASEFLGGHHGCWTLPITGHCHWAHVHSLLDHDSITSIQNQASLI